MSTLAPSASSFALICSAYCLLTFSLTGLGAVSTNSLASFRPSPVSSRTTLITWIFLSPTAARTASNSVCSSTATAGAPTAIIGAAATATGAAALTPNLSSRALTSSASSSTVRFSIAPRISSLFSFSFVAIVTLPPRPPPPLHHAALGLQLAHLADEVLDDLGGDHRVAVAEGGGGRSLQVDLQPLDPSLAGGDKHQAVFHHLVLHPYPSTG